MITKEIMWVWASLAKILTFLPLTVLVITAPFNGVILYYDPFCPSVRTEQSKLFRQFRVFGGMKNLAQKTRYAISNYYDFCLVSTYSGFMVPINYNFIGPMNVLM